MVFHDENNGGCMSVLIKDMEIPKCCDDCYLNYDQIHCIITGTQFYYNSDFDCGEERLPDCPLIEILPEHHGDLIDRNYLIKESLTEGDIDTKQIYDAPMIVKAE